MIDRFKKITEDLNALYAGKNKAYGNSFSETYRKLGLISAVTRISDKYNRLCNLATNPDIDNLGESLEDTLKDLACYSIMTLIELKENKDCMIYLKHMDLSKIKDYECEINKTIKNLKHE